MNTYTSFSIGAKSDRGNVRQHNEDSFAVSTSIATKDWRLPESASFLQAGDKGILMVIADGMGGAKGGEVAANTAIQAVQRYFNENITRIEHQFLFFKEKLEAAVHLAHQAILQKIQQEPALANMGTTICMAWLYQNYLFITWVGDSRLYLLRNSSHLLLLTKDHSYVQELVDSQKITEEEALSHPDKNIITQSLGDVTRPPACGFTHVALQAADRILLCSDGLNNMVRDHEIEFVLSSREAADYTVGNLIGMANKNGGLDNITVIVCDIVSLPIQNDLLYLHAPTPVVQANPTTERVKPLNENKNLRLVLFSVAALFILVAGYAMYVFIPNKSEQPALNSEKNTTPGDHPFTDSSNSNDRVKETIEHNNITANDIASESEDDEETGYEEDSDNLDEPLPQEPDRPKSGNNHKKDNALKKPVTTKAQVTVPISTTSTKASGEQVGKDDSDLKKASMFSTQLKQGKYYLVYSTNENKEYCENAIKIIRKKGGMAEMGQFRCSGANEKYYSIVNDRKYDTAEEAKEALNKFGNTDVEVKKIECQ